MNECLDRKCTAALEKCNKNFIIYARMYVCMYYMWHFLVAINWPIVELEADSGLSRRSPTVDTRARVSTHFLYTLQLIYCDTWLTIFIYIFFSNSSIFCTKNFIKNWILPLECVLYCIVHVRCKFKFNFYLYPRTKYRWSCFITLYALSYSFGESVGRLYRL